MSTSAFGVDHAVIRKNDDTPPSGGRQVTGALLPGWHGAVAGATLGVAAYRHHRRKNA